MAQYQSTVVDLRPTIVPKSDQLNADDLIGQTKTITITGVRLCSEPDQPVAVHFEGDNGKPYKPGKSMRRVLVKVWGDDASKFVGRRLTLYRDDNVKFGGMNVGGIRISHMSDIDREVAMVLTESKAKRQPFIVKPLRDEAPRQQQTQERPKPGLPTRIASFKEAVTAQATIAGMEKAWSLSGALRNDIDAADPEVIGETSETLQQWFNDAIEEREKAAKAKADQGEQF
jgi:hypothetical protein